MGWKRIKIKRQLPILIYMYSELGLSVRDIAFWLNRTEKSIRDQLKHHQIKRSEDYERELSLDRETAEKLGL